MPRLNFGFTPDARYVHTRPQINTNYADFLSWQLVQILNSKGETRWQDVDPRKPKRHDSRMLAIVIKK